MTFAIRSISKKIFIKLVLQEQKAYFKKWKQDFNQKGQEKRIKILFIGTILESHTLASRLLKMYETKI